MTITKNTVDLDSIKKHIDVPKDKRNELPDVDMSFLKEKSDVEITPEVFYAAQRKLHWYVTANEAGEDGMEANEPVYDYEYSKEEAKWLYEEDMEFRGAVQYFRGKDIIVKTSLPLPEPNPESDVIYIDEERVDILFDVIHSLYYDFYYDLMVEENITSAIKYGMIGGGSVISSVGAALTFGVPLVGGVITGIGLAMTLLADVISTKSKTMPSSIHNIRTIVETLVTFAKISPSNKKILIDGVNTYINAQICEYNDMRADIPLLNKGGLEYIMYELLPQFRKTLKDLSRRGGEATFDKLPELYPQAPGKDTTNEIDFARDPLRSEKDEAERRTSEGQSEGSILDFMRGRHTGERAGGEKFDFEYSKVGFDIKLAKAVEIDNTKIYAHNTAVIQAVKGFVLQICALHYCKYYKEATFYDDDIDISQNVPIDMKESEVNPSIRKFNAESSFVSLRAKCNRYNQGFQPAKPTLDIRLDLIDESVARYYKDYTELYLQLSDESKKEFEIIEYDENKKECFRIWEQDNIYGGSMWYKGDGGAELDSIIDTNKSNFEGAIYPEGIIDIYTKEHGYTILKKPLKRVEFNGDSGETTTYYETDTQKTRESWRRWLFETWQEYEVSEAGGSDGNEGSWVTKGGLLKKYTHEIKKISYSSYKIDKKKENLDFYYTLKIRRPFSKDNLIKLNTRIQERLAKEVGLSVVSVETRNIKKLKDAKLI